MSNLIKHAEEEFKLLGWTDGDYEMQKLICANVLELLQVFSNQGHSGTTAPYALGIFNKLVKFEAITPLTGEDSEWQEASFSGNLQNKRDSEVFKENGKAYWIRGKIFKRKDGCHFISGDSKVEITFPWTKPEPEIVEVEK